MAGACHPGGGQTRCPESARAAQGTAGVQEEAWRQMGGEGLESEGPGWTLKREIESSRQTASEGTDIWRRREQDIEARLGGHMLIPVWMCGLRGTCESPSGCVWEAGGPSEKSVPFLPMDPSPLITASVSSERRDLFEGSHDF